MQKAYVDRLGLASIYVVSHFSTHGELADWASRMRRRWHPHPLTKIRLGPLLELFVLHHLIDLPRHGLDVFHYHLVQIRIRVFADAQYAAHRVVVLLLQLKHIDMLIHTISHLPRDGKMIHAPRRRSDDVFVGCLCVVFFFGLGGVVGFVFWVFVVLLCV